jgi:hypothetical protein
MLSKELPPKRSCKFRRPPWPAIHIRVNRVAILNNDCNFRIMSAKLRAIVQIGGAADDNSVVSYENLCVISASFKLKIELFAMSLGLRKLAAKEDIKRGRIPWNAHKAPR